jgi:hypothetical protein
MVKYAVVLIHNNDAQRLRSAMAVIESIRSELDTVGISSELYEIHQQPKVEPVSRLEYLRLTILDSIIQIRYFRNYLKLPYKYWLPYVIGLAWSFSSLFASMQKRKRKKIESIITGKHFQSWHLFQKFDFLIILEDDIIQTGPLDELVKIAHQVAILDKDVPVYIDLAGGYPPNLINNKSPNPSSLELGKLYTNTACGYLLNSHLAQLLLSYYDSHNFTSKVGIDFFLNAAFSSLKTNLGFCFHLQRVGLSHGSFKGVFKSWTDTE